MASVVRLEPGGSSAVVAEKLSLDQAKEMAAHLKKIGDPPGCCWCVGVWDEEQQTPAKEATDS